MRRGADTLPEVAPIAGTCCYIAAGAYGTRFLSEGGGGLEGINWWQAGAALGASACAIAYIGNLAQKALADVEVDEGEENK